MRPTPSTLTAGEALARIIRSYLAREALTIAAAAEAAGLTHSSLGRRLAHPTRYPLDVDEVVALARVIDVPVSTLWAEVEAEQNRKAAAGAA